jgi:chloramphenicol O-acetyltransferase type A
MKRIINLNTWKRKEHFEFFSSFDDPFFGVTTTVDFTQVYEQSRKEGVSFFLYSVYFLLKCINALPAFRLRIENGQVVEYDEIHLSPTIGREDGTFGFAFFRYNADLSRFVADARKEMERVKQSSGLSFTADTERIDTIQYSAVPWFSFTEMKHPGSLKNGDSVPKISTGKLISENGRMLLPISIRAHHGLMDGRDVADFLQKIESLQG